MFCFCSPRQTFLASASKTIRRSPILEMQPSSYDGFSFYHVFIYPGFQFPIQFSTIAENNPVLRLLSGFFFLNPVFIGSRQANCYLGCCSHPLRIFGSFSLPSLKTFIQSWFSSPAPIRVGRFFIDGLRSFGFPPQSPIELGGFPQYKSSVFLLSFPLG